MGCWSSDRTEAVREGMLLGLRKARIVKLSDDESELLTGISNLENACKAFWHDDLKLMVVTSGRTGCAYFTREFSGMVESFAVGALASLERGAIPALPDRERVRNFLRRQRSSPPTRSPASTHAKCGEEPIIKSSEQP